MRKLFGMGRQIRAAKPVGSLKGSDNRKIDESASPLIGKLMKARHLPLVAGIMDKLSTVRRFRSSLLVMNQKMKVIHDTRVKM